MLKWFMLFVYVAIMTYILWRSLYCITGIHSKLKKKSLYISSIVIAAILCSTLILGGLFPSGSLKVILHKFSNVWLGFYLYLFTYIIFADIIILILKKIHKKNRRITILEKEYGRAIVTGVILAISITSVIYGYNHAEHIVTNSYEATVEKDAGAVTELNVVLISDFHLGYSIGCEMMEDMVNKVNALEPDLIVIAGDIVDNDYDALDDPERLASILSGLKSTYGTYAVYGNHDVKETLIGGFSIASSVNALRDERLEQLMEACHITMLEDESILVDDSFYLVGRLDAEKTGKETAGRESTENLLKNLDHSKPIFLLSHEPDELEENAEAGVDVMLSGHTHAGQFFPLTIVQPIVYQNYWGYLQVENMHSYVSSGIGVYGPKLRVLTDSEIMQIKLHFTGEKESGK